MVILTLPRLVSGRELASAMVTALGDISGADVVIDARATTTGTGSFAARLVRDIVVSSGAKHLTVAGAPADFSGYVDEAARKLDVRDQVELSQALPAASGA